MLIAKPGPKRERPMIGRLERGAGGYGLLWVVFCLFVSSGVNAAQLPRIYMPLPALSAHDIAVIINDADPLSVRIGNYYQAQRGIPNSQMIHIHFRPGRNVMSPTEFKVLKEYVEVQTPKHVQAYALTWIAPYRVDCMSITTAFAMGFDNAFCAEDCASTKLNPYFNSDSRQPYDDYAVRPSMIVAGENFQEAQALINRGVAADYTNPKGKSFLLQTSDKARSTRAGNFSRIEKAFKGLWDVEFMQQDYIENKQNVMFYFTGLSHVPKIQTNVFLPGAVADHLTSTGGELTGSSQMNVLEWLRGGVTGSYGSVVEPCNFPQKFPNPGIMMFNYLRGSTLLEAYWKSVAWPGQGVFVGEPLAKPFAWVGDVIAGESRTNYHRDVKNGVFSR